MSKLSIKDHSSSQNLLAGNRNLLSKTGKRVFTIAEDSLLEEQLSYQLLQHKSKPMLRFSFPTPRIVELKRIEYLVLTVFS